MIERLGLKAEAKSFSELAGAIYPNDNHNLFTKAARGALI
jgi:hypothetical protein